MSYSATCHLSSLQIQEGEEVVVLPMHYGTVAASSTLTNLTDNSLYPICGVIEGIYDGYGSVQPTDGKNIHFLNMVNDNLYNKQVENTEFRFSPKFVFFNDHRYIHNCDVDVLKDLKTNNYPKSDGFKNTTELLKLISEERLFNNGFYLGHIGMIIIKKAVFDKMQNGYYAKVKAGMIQDMKSACEKIKNNPKDAWQLVTLLPTTYRLEYDSAKLNEFFSNLLRSNFESDSFNEIVEYIASTSVLLSIYRDTGKSLYPNTTRSNTVAPLLNLNEVISEVAHTAMDKYVKEEIEDNDPEYMTEEEIQEVIDDVEEQKWHKC